MTEKLPELICCLCNRPIPIYAVSGKYTYMVAPGLWACADCYTARKHDKPSTPHEQPQQAELWTA